MARGRHRSQGRSGPQAQLKWAGEDEAIAPNGEEEHLAAALRVWLSTHCFPARQSFSRAPALDWHHLNSSGPAGPEGPAAPSVERTWGWNWSDLIKAVTAHQVVTRSWGQPEKVVTYLFPHLTYRRVPVWMWSVSLLEGTVPCH